MIQGEKQDPLLVVDAGSPDAVPVSEFGSEVQALISNREVTENMGMN